MRKRRKPCLRLHCLLNRHVVLRHAGICVISVLDCDLTWQVDLVFLDYTPNMSAELELTKKSLYYEKLIRALLSRGGNPAVVGMEVRCTAGAGGKARATCRRTIEVLQGTGGSSVPTRLTHGPWPQPQRSNVLQGSSPGVLRQCIRAGT